MWKILNNRLRTNLVKFKTRTDGNIAVTFAIAIVGIMMGLSVAIDLNRASETRRYLQDVTDAAALAGAAAMEDEKNRRKLTYSTLKKNFVAKIKGRGKIDSYSIKFNDRARTVRVEMSTTLKASLLPILGKSGYKVAAGSTATKGTPGGSAGCLHVLDPNTANALTITGNASVGGKCEVTVASTNARSVSIRGNGRVGFDKICNAGGSVLAGNARVHPKPDDHCRVGPDPLASLSPPVPSVPNAHGCDYNNVRKWGQISVKLNPGVYCGGLQVGGSIYVTFNPGTYIIKDGPVSIAGSSVVSFEPGEYIFKNATVQMTGNGRIRFRGRKLVVQNGKLVTKGNGSFVFEKPLEVLVDNSPFSITGNGTLKAENIFIYFKGPKASFDTRGDARVTLKAPTSGKYANLLIYQNPQNATKRDSYFVGSGYLTYKGNIYIPSWKAKLWGSAFFTSEGGSIVAREAAITGNGRVNLKSGSISTPANEAVRLIH